MKLWQLLLLCLAATGCDNIFRIDHLTYHGDGSVLPPDAKPPDDSSESDALVDATGTRACTNGAPVLQEPFDPTMDACQPWGTAYNDVGVGVAQNGALRVTANNAFAAVGGCTSNSNLRFAFSGEGVRAKVDSVITNGSNYNVLEIYGPPNLVIKESSGFLAFQTGNSQPIGTSLAYNSTLKYWRLPPDPVTPTSAIIAEASTNGTTWMQIGDKYSTSVPADVGIELAFGTNASGGVGTASVDELLICP